MTDRIAGIEEQHAQNGYGYEWVQDDIRYLLDEVKRWQKNSGEWASRTHEQDYQVTLLREKIEKLEAVREAAENHLQVWKAAFTMTERRSFVVDSNVNFHLTPFYRPSNGLGLAEALAACEEKR